MSSPALYTYSIYGLCVRSDLRLDGVQEGAGEPDVFVRRGAVQTQAARPVPSI